MKSLYKGAIGLTALAITGCNTSPKFVSNQSFNPVEHKYEEIFRRTHSKEIPGTICKENKLEKYCKVRFDNSASQKLGKIDPEIFGLIPVKNNNIYSHISCQGKEKKQLIIAIEKKGIKRKRKGIVRVYSYEVYQGIIPTRDPDYAGLIDINKWKSFYKNPEKYKEILLDSKERFSDDNLKSFDDKKSCFDLTKIGAYNKPYLTIAKLLFPTDWSKKQKYFNFAAKQASDAANNLIYLKKLLKKLIVKKK